MRQLEESRNLKKEMYKGTDQEAVPIMIKANTAGALETLMKETYKIIG